MSGFSYRGVCESVSELVPACSCDLGRWISGTAVWGLHSDAAWQARRSPWSRPFSFSERHRAAGLV